MNDFYSMILQVLKLFMCVVAQLPQTTLQHLNLVCTRFLYSVRQDAIGRKLTCFIEDIKTDESFCIICPGHQKLHVLFTLPGSNF